MKSIIIFASVLLGSLSAQALEAQCELTLTTRGEDSSVQITLDTQHKSTISSLSTEVKFTEIKEAGLVSIVLAEVNKNRVAVTTLDTSYKGNFFLNLADIDGINGRSVLCSLK